MEELDKKNTNLSLCKTKVFERVFNLHAPLLHSFIYYKCGDADMSEDIVQEAFVKLWENCKKVLFLKAKSFVYTVAKNLFLNHVSHQKVRLKYHQETPDELNIESPEYIMEESEFRVILNDAIADLPEKQRVVFLLNRIEKKTYAEIAEMLDVSVKAIEKRMHNALVSLREKIDHI
ncbi:RNA polymerase sigma-70 factor [Ancylomarina euxinus]|uniref:RNA polymerase sigma-70 factor n=1 Tax=Ancylomarina euxinus TaxID=2283627 RepID=A0A425Y862_9BACT|nr:RNA polymerase sigma-70 factor [Ancylomarina euxinus]MCZ4693456.1 RNA polymerase sigma-70 factor [Ancylomarina euxinus]MUP13683.1 RNA polymerase sigma-70 factor [Ancylomarina euxinus]RRG24676.1 RNA polymerase sigma-70 factor [Ancylomarina euxinus]